MNQPMRKNRAGPNLLESTLRDVDNANKADADKTAGDPTTKVGSPDQSGFKKVKSLKENTVTEGRALIVSTVECSSDPLCCQYNEDYSLLAAGCTNGRVELYSTLNNELLLSLEDNETKGKTASVTSVKHRPVSNAYPVQNCYTCTYVNGLVKCWNYNFKQCIYTIRELRQTFGLTYHPRLPKFVTFGDDLKLYLYDEETKIQERVLQSSEKREIHDGPQSRVFAARFNPRSNYEFLTGGWDDVIHLWDLRAPHAIKHIPNVHICGEGIDINKRGTEILTAAWSKEDQIKIWDYSSFRMITTLQPDVHASKLYCGKYISSDFAVTSGGDPPILRIVDLQTQLSAVIMYNMPSAVYNLDLAGPKKVKQIEVAGRPKADLNRVPKIAFICGNKLNQLDVY